VVCSVLLHFRNEENSYYFQGNFKPRSYWDVNNTQLFQVFNPRSDAIYIWTFDGLAVLPLDVRLVILLWKLILFSHFLRYYANYKTNLWYIHILYIPSHLNLFRKPEVEVSCPTQYLANHKKLPGTNIDIPYLFSELVSLCAVTCSVQFLACPGAGVLAFLVPVVLHQFYYLLHHPS
jgi:hypothetical protein